MTLTVRVEGPLPELRKFREAILTSFGDTVEVRGPSETSRGLLDDDELGISPLGDLIIVYVAHLGAEGTIDIVKQLTEKIKGFKSLRMETLPKNDDTEKQVDSREVR